MKNVLLNQQPAADPIESILKSSGATKLPPSKEEMAAALDAAATRLMHMVGAILTHRRDVQHQKVGILATQALLTLAKLAEAAADQTLPSELRAECSSYLKALPGYVAGSPPAAEAQAKHQDICIRVVRSMRSGRSILDIIKGKR